MNNEHPTFANPMIQEALCEIHFRLPPGVAWKPSLPGEFFKHIQPEFPELEPVTQVGVHLHFGPGGVEQTYLPPQQRMRYKHASRNLLLQLAENIFTVNLLSKYPGWTHMSADVLHAWEQARQVIKPVTITQIGLRYINRIERTYSDERPSDWLAPSDYIPKSALLSLPGFFVRVETRPDPHNRLIVTLGETANGSIAGTQAMVFDIDCIIEKDIGIDNESITKETTRLHDIAWCIFSASMTSRLERLLQGGGL